MPSMYPLTLLFMAAKLGKILCPVDYDIAITFFDSGYISICQAVVA